MSRKEVNLTDSFSKLMHFAFPVYLNKRIERKKDGFEVFGVTHPTWEEATKAVDEFYENFPQPKNILK